MSCAFRERGDFALTWKSNTLLTNLLPGVATFAMGAVLLLPAATLAADSSPTVEMESSKAAPRTLEPLTETRIVRDYRFAWASLGQALETDSASPLNGPFVGAASVWLHEAVANQRRTGLSSRYRNQVHKVEAVFYAPEGDLIELHDTAEYDLQLLDGSRAIHDDHITMRYVVLMTPGADRWVVRQLQAVPHF
jgi:hypothetical protein